YKFYNTNIYHGQYIEKIHLCRVPISYKNEINLNENLINTYIICKKNFNFNKYHGKYICWKIDAKLYNDEYIFNYNINKIVNYKNDKIFGEKLYYDCYNEKHGIVLY